MYSLAWLVIVGVIGAVLGAWLGNLIARVRSNSAVRIQELEAQLESARAENSSYRREVFDQFAATARKFKSLDESYNDLHRQLAASARQLCGEAAGPLLAAPERAEIGADSAAADAAADVEPVAAKQQAAEPSAADEQADAVADVAEDDVPILVAEVSEAQAANGGAADEDEPAEASGAADEDDQPAKRMGDAA